MKKEACRTLLLYLPTAFQPLTQQTLCLPVKLTYSNTTPHLCPYPISCIFSRGSSRDGAKDRDVWSPLCIVDKRNLSWSLSTNECHSPGPALSRTLLTLFLLVILQSALPAGQPCHLPLNLTINLYERAWFHPIGAWCQSNPAAKRKRWQPGGICSPWKWFGGTDCSLEMGLVL